MDPIKYDVFISYSRKDYVDENQTVIPGNVVSLIKETFSKEGISYWFDEDGIYSGQNFVEKIVTNIEASQIFVFLSTVNSNNSKYTCKEIASADEFGKHIIPVRIDSSPYNKKVLFRIADLNYIDYSSNPEKGLADLVSSIKAHLEKIKQEEKRRQEEENRRKENEKRKQEELQRQKEEEEKRRQKEQEQLVENIQLACRTLNNEAAKLELDRTNLLLEVKKVTDLATRASLKQFILDSGPKSKESDAHIQQIKDAAKKESEELRERKAMLEGNIAVLEKELQTAKNELARYKYRLNELEKERKSFENSAENKYKDKIQALTQELEDKSRQLAELQSQLRSGSAITKKKRALIIIAAIVLGLVFWSALLFGMTGLRNTHDNYYYEEPYIEEPKTSEGYGEGSTQEEDPYIEEEVSEPQPATPQ